MKADLELLTGDSCPSGVLCLAAPCGQRCGPGLWHTFWHAAVNLAVFALVVGDTCHKQWQQSTGDPGLECRIGLKRVIKMRGLGLLHVVRHHQTVSCSLSIAQGMESTQFCTQLWLMADDNFHFLTNQSIFYFIILLGTSPKPFISI